MCEDTKKLETWDSSLDPDIFLISSKSLNGNPLKQIEVHLTSL